MPHNGYDPKTSTVVPEYVVKTAGNRWFIPAYPDPRTTAADDLAECKKLSPKGVEKVA